MIAVDTNILMYGHRRESPFHVKARAAIEGPAEGAGAWAIPWPCIAEFVSVATHPRILSPPSSPAQAVDQIEAWLESPTLTLLFRT